MAFGFPAYHEEEIDDLGGPDEVRDRVDEALHALGWSVGGEARRVLHASTGVSLWSWGEKITIEFLRGGGLRVRSECSLPTQCVDWGKNRRNVERFLAEVERDD